MSDNQRGRTRPLSADAVEAAYAQVGTIMFLTRYRLSARSVTLVNTRKRHDVRRLLSLLRRLNKMTAKLARDLEALTKVS